MRIIKGNSWDFGSKKTSDRRWNQSVFRVFPFLFWGIFDILSFFLIWGPMGGPYGQMGPPMGPQIYLEAESRGGEGSNFFFFKICHIFFLDFVRI